MKNKVITSRFFSWILLSIILVISNEVNAQTVTVDLATTITHNTCAPTLGSCSYSINPSNGWKKSTRVTSLKLYYDNYVTMTSDLVFDHLAYYTNSFSTGIAPNLQPGHYYFTGAISTTDNSGVTISVSILKHIWVGYNTQWENQSELLNTSTPNSLFRSANAIGNTYGYAQSFNTSTQNYGFIEFKKKTSTTYPSNIYLVLNPPTLLSTFTPTGNYQYLQINQTSASAGNVILKYYNGSTYVTTTLSTNALDRVRFFRLSNGTCQVQLNDNTTNVAPTFSISGALKVTVFIPEVNTEGQSIVSSFPCAAQTIDQLGVSEVKRELDGGYATTKSGQLKFFYEEEYSVAPNKFIPINIYNPDNVKIASCDINGVGASYLKKAYSFDNNMYTINFTGASGFVVGSFYTLEIISSTGEKRYLRFKYNN